MHVSARLENLQKVLNALEAVVDKDGFCYGTASLAKIGALTGLAPVTVRAYVRALEGLRVVAAARAPGPKPLTGTTNLPRLRFQLLRPGAVIDERNGFFYVKESGAKG